MPTLVPRIATAALAFTLSTAALVALPATANQPSPTGPSKTGTPKGVAAPADVLAVGLIVRTRDSSASAPLRSRVARAAAEPVDSVETSGSGRMKVAFDEPVSFEAAEELASRVEGLAGVVSVEPNVLFTRSVNAPVTTNDPYFSQQYGVWDKYFVHIAGGFSVKAPPLWRATKGSSAAVVAIIDTGFTVHPDLDANRVAGYDFVSTESDTSNRDGLSDGPVEGWDGDASDPGDYTTAGQCGYAGTFNSSWHGTHVAGIVAGIDNNSKGITGVAPNVKFQPIRVLGPCGGSLSDIASAILWAGGVAVPGVPANATPAKVINMSLGVNAPCSVELQSAISAVRANGVVVTAAAGNSNSVGIDSPANCAGVIAVTATDEFGQSTTYSNVGNSSRRADISAPGGENGVEGYSGIVSTLNTGTTTLGSPSYAFYSGTSMATPHVAAGAALLSSLGYNKGQIEDALKRAVRPFPQWGDPWDCRSSQNAGPDDWDCGRGILDLSKVPALYGKRTISGTAKAGKTLSITTKATGGVKPKYRWFRGTKPISSATKATYKLKSADKGKKIKVRVTISKSGFRTQSFTSSPRKVAR